MPARKADRPRGAQGAARQPRNRAEQREATRRELIAATIDSIAASGFADTTLSRVSERARLSRSLVNFHFRSKDALLVEVLRFLSDEYRTLWMRALDKAGPTPAARLQALLDVDFHPLVCNRKKIAVWYAFWGESRSRPTYLEICDAADWEHFRALVDAFAAVVAEGAYDGIDPEMAASGLSSMTDGLWLDLLLSPQRFDREAARRTCLAYLAALFPRHFDQQSRPGAAQSAA